VFFPEIFSPVATNYENKWAYVQGMGIENIMELYVFNRWGEKVFENHNFQANDRSLGWDGTHNGEILNPGVFVYYFKLQFYDGTEYSQSGDITLVH
jgi:gliding motility-associated-like protein